MRFHVSNVFNFLNDKRIILPIPYHIKENSFPAWLASKKLRKSTMAIVLGKTIHLHNTSKEDFLKNEKWLKHELCHIKQFRQHGFIGFMFKYAWESIKHGYTNNKYELEAQQAEDAS